MMRALLAAVAAVVALIAAVIANLYFCWGPPTTVVLVRHADRQGTADALSNAGVTRAQELAHVMAKSGITAIYTSEALRTQETAAPTAAALGLVPAAVAAADVVGLADRIRANQAGQSVLVVGHSDSVPQVIAEFGGPAVDIPADEFDNLYILTLCRCRWQGVALTNLQYGATSP